MSQLTKRGLFTYAGLRKTLFDRCSPPTLGATHVHRNVRGEVPTHALDPVPHAPGQYSNAEVKHNPKSAITS
eukprot:918358-Rhodomonas_salina.4